MLGTFRIQRRRALRFGLAALATALAGSVALAAPLRVKDERGVTISLPASPRRILSVAPSNTEILFALGLSKKIVGVTDYCDYPAAAKKKPKVGGMILNMEKIVALKPDLIFAKYDLQKSGIEQMEKLGLRVYAVNPRTVQDTLATVAGIGRATGTEARAKAIVAKMRRELAQAKLVSARDKKHPRVLSIIQSKPLIVAGPKTFMDDAIRRAGAVNVAEDAKEPYAPFSLEAAVSRRPEVLLLSAGVEPRAIVGDPAWRTVPAVRNRRVYAPDLMHILERPCPRLSSAILELAELLHPKK
jgi:iron complex transport system substrate-binding protein